MKEFYERMEKIQRKNNTMVELFLACHPLRAFLKRFTRSSGKEAMKGFLSLACAVREKNLHSFFCGPVGSSNDPTEKLPVELVRTEIHHRSPDRLSMNLRRSASGSSMDMLSHDESNDGEISDSPISPLAVNKAGKRSSQQGISADTILLAGHKPNWPRYLFICEVKAESLDKAATSQLIREMLPAMLSQSLVFGILMNSTSAWICAMRHDFKNKKLCVTYHVFNFLTWDSTGFNFESFEAFFMRILHYLNYGFKHIKAIRH